MWRNYILKIRGNPEGLYTRETRSSLWEEGKNGTQTNSIGSNVYNMENSSYLQ